MGKARFAELCEMRARRMMDEREDPFIRGFHPEIWNIVDDLLVDGTKVVLDLTRIARIMPEKRAPADMPDIPVEIAAAAEIWLAGSNRSSKSEYGAQKCMRVLKDNENARGWSFADTGPISIARQQPLFWKYLPREIKQKAEATGKAKQGTILNISYKQKTGFAEQSFVLDNASQHWFKNYEQDLTNVEGDQLDIIWLDELRNVDLLKTLRGRMGDRGGIIIVTFTSIDENYSSIVNEYEKGARTLLEVPAELLPIKGDNGKPIPGKFEKVPRIKVAGPGSDGNQRANIVYFHITDNPYYGYEAALRLWQKTKQFVIFGKDRFYAMYRNAVRSKILSRVYGILSGGGHNQFPKFNDAIHIIEPDRIPRQGSDYMITDPCDGRSWFMIWIRVDSRGRWFVRREWPSFSTNDKPNQSPSAYIPGVGDPGPWTLPGQPKDGVRGPAQQSRGFGLERYKQEILRCEGHKPAIDQIEGETPAAPLPPRTHKDRFAGKHDKKAVALSSQPLNPSTLQPISSAPEEILERWMDSRYAANPNLTKEGQTTTLDQMAELGMQFRAASGKEIVEGIDMIRGKLDYDSDVEIGKFSPTLARTNEPTLFISSECPNTIYALKEWTGLDKQHGACKDPIDVLRYACLARLDYVGEGAYAWQGGGSY